MNNYTITEFSIFYKRLIFVELCIKNLLISKYTSIYGLNAYNILYRYFKTIQTKRNTNDKTFEKINNSNLSDDAKLTSAIHKMYLSELLNIFANPVFLKNKKVKNTFFDYTVHTNSTEFQQYCKMLKNFRNCIAHCNIKKYSIERNKFIKSLLYFEKILKCNPVLSYDILYKINKSRKLSTKEILHLIYNVDKKYFYDDRKLILLFDDIALINGYTFYDLPQRKTIIRIHYSILENAKNGNIIETTSIENNQMRLFD